jgi:4-amino-4-deoxy-L-arabinose transferase-like glycosyltransferase
MCAAPDAPATALPVGSGPSSAGAIGAFVRRHELVMVVLLSLALLLSGLWAFSLIDPWETHYGEVARRMLQDDDWVHLKKQHEIFRSKPVLTFWLIGASLSGMGLATDGGYSGELVTSDLFVFAVRLPFALFGAFGLVMTWWMLARLVNRRVAWLAFAVIATCPMYCLVARQAITDMPLLAALMGAVACFAMAVHRGDEPLAPFFRRGRLRIDAHHHFLVCLSLFALWQAAYYAIYFHMSPGWRPACACGSRACSSAAASSWPWPPWPGGASSGVRCARAARCGCTGSTSSSA